MKLNSRARLQLRLQSGVFLILFIALLADHYLMPVSYLTGG